MGFLDGTTNNIIIDAVLTKYGRQALARNDGSFSIVKFALGDDEVDYTLVKQYGIDVGKEKIEKNTLVLEAQTGENLAIKYKLVSVSNASVIYVPKLTLVTSLSNNVLSLLTSRTSSLVLQQTMSSGEVVDPELVDQIFEVTINNRFLTVSGRTPDVLSTGDTVTYLIPQSGGVSPSGGSTCQFTIGSRALSASTFNTYGTKNNKSLIRTYINVKGSQSGASTDIEVNITQT
jgi:hypothetical protein